MQPEPALPVTPAERAGDGVAGASAAAAGVPGAGCEAAAQAAPEQRRGLRRALIERREALSTEAVGLASAMVSAALRAHFPQLPAQRVAFCWPMRNEIDLRPLMLSWLKAARPGFQPLLPVVVAAAQPLAFRAWVPPGFGQPPTPLAVDRHGIPYPASGDFVSPEVLLIPVNAVDAAGYRLGYGGGYFDRTLAAMTPRPLAIGIGFDFARVPTVWPQAHDEPLTALVTDSTVVRYAR